MSINKTGTLIVIDGIDGTGKHTQSEVLYHTLISEYELTPGKDIAIVSFPRYGTAGCTMVEKYLNGDFCNDPNTIDPYTASMFYIIDQSISYKTEAWGEVYRNGGIVIADRYYTSNIIHQGSKFLDPNDPYETSNIKAYIHWLINTSLNKVGVPSPDLICWLIANKDNNEKMLKHRDETDSTHNTDIHEANRDYLNKCRDMLNMYCYLVMADATCDQFLDNFKAINLCPEAFINITDSACGIRSIEDISNEILQRVHDLEYFNN